MKFITKLPLALALIIGGVTTPVFAEHEHHEGKEDGHHAGKKDGHHAGLDKKLRAEATISGPGITGEAQLYQEYEGLVKVKMTLQGKPGSKLTPGRHAVHFHETGACEPTFGAAKGHYDGNIDPMVNPGANVSPGLGNHPYHLGDLPNLEVDENGKGTMYAMTSRVTLSPSLTSLFDADGTAFIIHELEDQFLPDPPTKDAPGGPRIACGVIVKK